MKIQSLTGRNSFNAEDWLVQLLGTNIGQRKVENSITKQSELAIWLLVQSETIPEEVKAPKI